MGSDVHALVYGSKEGDLDRAGRTLRSLQLAELAPSWIGELTERKFRKLLGAERPVLLLRAGTWLKNAKHYTAPLPSASGKGLCALGRVRSSDSREDQASATEAQWTDLLRKSGGDFSRLSPQSNDLVRFLVEPAAMFLDRVAVCQIADSGATSFQEIARLACQRLRLVHFPALDVLDGDTLRVLQVITALHRGGAERVTLDLVQELPAQGVVVQLATLGRAMRQCYPSPPGAIECALRGPGTSLEVLVREAIAFGADVIHGHLVGRAETRHISAAGFPVVLTLHNTRAGWPPGIGELQPGDATLLVACAAAVEKEVRAAALPVPVRTVRNGIDADQFRPGPRDSLIRAHWRGRWEFKEEDLVLIAVANPRPQKRLHLLPAILDAVRQRLGSSRQARLVLCGEPVPGKHETEKCISRTQMEIARLGLEAHVRWIGPASDVRELLAAADALVSTSAHEGLSLAQLEALAMGRAVVATDVGGTGELAWNNPSLHLVPADAAPAVYAQILSSLGSGEEKERTFPREHWSSRAMAANYARLYRRAIVRVTPRRRAEGLWLITNNLSVGGAQSSARRLLIGLNALGEKVRAAVIEEDPRNPTPGRVFLTHSGIPVRAVAPRSSPDELVEELLVAIDNDPPEAVVFWNLQPSIKVLLAEAFLDVPVFDVSPGEMYFASLERHFANCPPGQPAWSAAEYGRRLAGMIAKYHAEAAQARAVLQTPVAVVPNGVPLTPVRPPAPKTSESVIFGTAARIHPQKRLEDLMAAFRRVHRQLPAAQLLIAGGVERGCENYAARLAATAAGLPVAWLGEVTDIPRFHALLDIFVMISEPAGCPNASLEAMASGLPVIATGVGGASEQVIDEITGRLVPPRNTEALAAAMVDLGTHPERWATLGQAGRNRIEKAFSLDRMLSEYRRILLRR